MRLGRIFQMMRHTLASMTSILASLIILVGLITLVALIMTFGSLSPLSAVVVGAGILSRNFLRLFCGVHKKFLAGYVAMIAWAHNLKRVTAGFLRALVVPHFTFRLT